MLARFVLLFAVLMLTCSCGHRQAVTGASDPAGLPGLLPVFFDGKFRHIDEVPPVDHPTGRPGAPVKVLSHDFGNGEIYDSGRSQGIGVQLTGRIHLEQVGVYQFRVMANDGVRLRIAGRTVAEDPEVHGDRWTQAGSFSVITPGWHPMAVSYYQRKGTARLELAWQPPGAAEFTTVPAAVLSHER